MKAIYLISLKLIIILFFITGTAFSQNTIFIGTKSYNSTKWWGFLNANIYESWQPNSTLAVCIAKSTSGAMLVLSAQTLSSDEYIGGTVIIYLNDGSAISLANRINKDNADGRTTVIYSLNGVQINSLKRNTILKIRYTIVGPYIKNSYTGENRHNISLTPGVYDERTYNTASEIAELLEKQ
jgi:hypothetical protein